MDSFGVYSITSPSGKKYIGMTMDSFANRWRNHLKELRNGRHKCLGLKRAYLKYGELNLVFEVIKEFPDATDISAVLLQEQKSWDQAKRDGIKLYNGRPTGTGSVHHTEETKRKISEKARARSREPLSYCRLYWRECVDCKSTFAGGSPKSKSCWSCKLNPAIGFKLICKSCNNEFTAKSKSRKLCSKTCRNSSLSSEADCKRCGEKIAKNSRKKYCSIDCRRGFIAPPIEELIKLKSKHTAREIADMFNTSHTNILNMLKDIEPKM